MYFSGIFLPSKHSPYIVIVTLYLSYGCYIISIYHKRQVPLAFNTLDETQGNHSKIAKLSISPSSAPPIGCIHIHHPQPSFYQLMKQQKPQPHLVNADTC